MEYPLIDCKEAHIGFWTCAFPMIFALAFGFFGFVFPFIFLKAGEAAGGGGEFSFVILICIPFAVIGVVSLFIALTPIVRFLLVKFLGKPVTATVYGYTDDNVLLNGVPAQVVKLLVNTRQGNRFLMSQRGKTIQPYGVNTRIQLRVYKKYFLIDEKVENLF